VGAVVRPSTTSLWRHSCSRQVAVPAHASHPGRSVTLSCRTTNSKTTPDVHKCWR
jgi:hypothetical protein